MGLVILAGMKVIQISDEAYKTLARWKLLTGLPMGWLARAAIKMADREWRRNGVVVPKRSK